MIESYASRRQEDYNKNRETRSTRHSRGEDLNKIHQSEERIEENTGGAAETVSNNRAKETFLKGKGLPYVDLNPIRKGLSPGVSQGSPGNSHATRPPSENVGKVAGTSYKSRAPVEVGLDVEQLVEDVLDLEISVPLRSLAGLSGAIQKEIRKQITKTKVPIEEPKEKSTVLRVETLPVESYMVMSEVSDEVPEGHLVASDPVLQYLLENKDNDQKPQLVAKPTEALRAIYAQINGVGQEECLMDDGSMIISMGKEVAVQLGLNWDPAITMNMESASNHIEPTLGLAKNVCFRVGGLNLFLQVHILANPPYRVLLGRPFSSFTQSIVRNKANGESDVELTDPNTGQKAMVPTYQRGVGPEVLQKNKLQGF
jgi:hypothetical protein